MSGYTLEIGGHKIKLNSSKILSDSLPQAWYEKGLDRLDLTLLWRHYAQQLPLDRIAEDLCVHSDQRVLATNFFTQRVAEARRIIKSCPVDPNRLRGLPKLLINYLS